MRSSQCSPESASRSKQAARLPALRRVFLVAASTMPSRSHRLRRRNSRQERGLAGVAGKLLATCLIAAAPFSRGRILARDRACAGRSRLVCLTLAIWSLVRSVDMPGSSTADDQPLLLIVTLALQSFLSLVALIGSACASETTETTCIAGWGSPRPSRSSPNCITCSTRRSPAHTSPRAISSDSRPTASCGRVWRPFALRKFGRAVARGALPVSPARSTMGSPSTSSSARPMRACSRTEPPPRRGSPRSRRRQPLRSRRHGSRSSPSPRRAEPRRSTPPSGAYVRRPHCGRQARSGAGGRYRPLARARRADRSLPHRAEGLANVRKHAGEGAPGSRSASHGTERTVVVRDDGDGFDGDTDPAGQGLTKPAREGGCDRRRSPALDAWDGTALG